MEILENISLKKLNTFGVEVKARRFVAVRNEHDIKELFDSDILGENNSLILGNGSNVLFVNDFDGLVIHSQMRGITICESNDDYVILNVAAGELWHNFVTISLTNKYFGLENLALIPGTVGAAAVQNIGAYGSEQKDFFFSVRGYNLIQNEFQELDAEQCRFGYRDSVFKNELKNKFFITSVKYKLSKREKVNLSYSELLHEAERFGIKQPDARYVYDTVCRLRKSKLPDPKILGNAGSFFKNPVVSESTFNDLKEKYPEIKGYRNIDDKIKVSAAWFIEKAEWKGKRIGDAGVFNKHALILVNYGNASGKDIYELSEKIRLSVLEMFGVNLEPEVQIIKST